MSDGRAVPDEAVEAMAASRRERKRGDTLPWAELPEIAKAPIRAEAAADLQAALPALRAEWEREKGEELLHPFLIQAVALECSRLPVDPKTGPSDDDLSEVEAEVRQEVERAWELAVSHTSEEKP